MGFPNFLLNTEENQRILFGNIYSEPLAMYTTTNLNLRNWTSVDSEIVTTLKRGSEVQVSGDYAIGWSKITSGDYEGYVSSEYLSTEKPVLQEIKEVPTTSVNSYSEYELQILAKVINGEAGSDWLSDLHQQMVASVVLNRVNNPSFPSTIEGVIYQPYQFSCTNDGNWNKPLTDRAVANARHILENGSILPPGVLYFAQGTGGRQLYQQIEGHYFCY